MPDPNPAAAGGFNSAAAVKPRRRFSLRLRHAPPTLLQFGRGGEAAETFGCRRQEKRGAFRLLQFGRGGEAAETSRINQFLKYARKKLQFGRGGEAAETKFVVIPVLEVTDASIRPRR